MNPPCFLNEPVKPLHSQSKLKDSNIELQTAAVEEEAKPFLLNGSLMRLSPFRRPFSYLPEPLGERRPMAGNLKVQLKGSLTF